MPGTLHHFVDRSPPVHCQETPNDLLQANFIKSGSCQHTFSKRGHKGGAQTCPPSSADLNKSTIIKATNLLQCLPLPATRQVSPHGPNFLADIHNRRALVRKSTRRGAPESNNRVSTDQFDPRNGFRVGRNAYDLEQRLPLSSTIS